MRSFREEARDTARVFVVARDCGHGGILMKATYWPTSGSIDYCEVCHAYVGLIVHQSAASSVPNDTP